MIEILRGILRMQREGQESVLVSIVASSGSVPRGAGSHMLAARAGRVCGTIGGGAVEGRCLLLAQEVLRTGASQVEAFSLDADDVQNLGMICGGRVTVYMRRLPAADAALAALAQWGIQQDAQGLRTWLVEDMAHGALTLVCDKETLGAALPEAVRAQLGEKPAMIEHGGTAYYGEMIVRPGRVWVFGGGHVAQALVPLLAGIGFRCVVVEERAEFADPALFGGAAQTMLVREGEWAARIPVCAEDYICVMTRGHKSDLAVQAFALTTPASYIGVIGSRRKIAATNEKLRALGFADADIARITTPIGLPIGAITPAEIAVSIAAQLIEKRAQGR